MNFLVLVGAQHSYFSGLLVHSWRLHHSPYGCYSLLLPVAWC